VSVFVLTLSTAFAQKLRPTFEVASVRPSNPHEALALRGGPGTSDPAQIAYTGVPLPILILKAYVGWDEAHPQNTPGYRISGLPAVVEPLYDIRARVPPDTTEEQFRLMLQELLAERFSLRVHHEIRDVPGYQLVIAKNGPKLKAAAKGTAPLPEGALDEVGENRNLRLDKNGDPQLVPGYKGRVLQGTGNGAARVSARMQSLADIVIMCQTWTGRPIVDKTGLTGIYDFDLDFAPRSAPDSHDAALPFEFALTQQLGLKLDPKKVPSDVIVIDHLEKRPTEN
jgi:uncharacterized protein (TIGR03435 family)